MNKVNSYIRNTYKLRNSLIAFRLVSVSSFSNALLLPSDFVVVFLRFLLAVRDESKEKRFLVNALRSRRQFYRLLFRTVR